MYKKEYNLITFLFYFLFFTSFSFAAESNNISSVPVRIDDMDRSWFSVLSGSPSSAPLQTNYGFLIVEDSKFLSCYSRSGQRLWQTNTGAKILNIAISETEFISVVNQKNQIQLINPSGLILWNKQLTFTPISSPLFGFDGRIFVRGTEDAACFGINGIQKWTCKTETQSALSPKLLNDGSMILFLEKTHDSKTCALRISPFGSVLEEIVFQGKVVNASSCDAGIILVFSSGEIGMCAIKTDASKENGLIYSKWINKDVHCSQYSISRKMADGKFSIYTPKGNILILNQNNGVVEKSISVPEINEPAVLYFETVDDKFIIAQTSSCVIYNTSGRVVKNIQMPSKTGKYNWEYSCFMNSGFIVFLSKDWTVNSFKLISTSREKESPTFSYYKNKKMISGYKNYIKSSDYKPEKDQFSQEVYKTLQEGNIGQKEIDISNTINDVITAYFNDKTTLSSNRENIEYITINYNLSDMEKVLNFVPLLQSHYFQQKVALLLSVENDTAMIVKLLKTAGQCGYDPAGEILSQIELLVRRTNPKDQIVLTTVCDTVYEICRFMGRPALLSKGKEILMGLFYPQYDEATKKAARLAMQKLADLNM